MSRVFAYCRVSTIGQTTANQVGEIQAAGFAIDKRRIVEEQISGSVSAMERPGFAKLIDRLESGDVLVVSRMDRLGRNAMNVRATIELLSGMGVRVHCLALGGVDLCSSAGKMTMQVICAVSEFEKDLLVERTHAGLARAKSEGKTLGRPTVLTAKQRVDITKRLADGATISALARELGVSRQSVTRAKEAATA